MSDVIFYDEEENAPIRPPKAVKPSLFSRLIMSTGLAKNVAQAEQVLLIVAILGLVASVGIVLAGYLPQSQTSQAAITAATARIEVEQLQAEQAQEATLHH